ncbi:general stress protein [Mycobacterium sp. IDR2000157661]|uniref:general stress protein n=1 Tax=Mycobacterium sp. IDR2000157661 TaxID=2867005 RepID=UPI001EEBD4F1|nr:general stress protein [Mycobacterium sp. IDR2000157661]ULE33510.1 hypothetical protein K3G64_01990 [Mycobacterium sp. IDR2000157661]
MSEPTNATEHQDADARTLDKRRLLASFSDYADAQALVDRMSDGGFPVEHVSIVGDGVRTVEHVTGRVTKAKAALAGAGTGAWLGAFVGLLFLLFTVGPFWYWIWVLLIPILIGALFGAVFGFVAHWSTRGKRDFSSVQTLMASRYDVFVSTEHVEAATRFVSQR